MNRVSAVVLLTVVLPTQLFAQPAAPGPIGLTQAPSEARTWSNIEVYLSIGVLVFSIIVMALQYWHLKHQGQSWNPEAVTRFIGFPLVISASLFLVVAGYSDQQVAPVFALLGAIAGYLFGKSGTSSDAKTSES